MNTFLIFKLHNCTIAQLHNCTIAKAHGVRSAVRSEDRIRSNLSKTKNIPPKAVIFSDFCCTFAMSLTIFACLDLQH